MLEAGGHQSAGASQQPEVTDAEIAIDTALSTVQRLPEATTRPCCPARERGSASGPGELPLFALLGHSSPGAAPQPGL